MPQKRNPDAAELMRAAAPRLTADLGGLLGVLHGLPLAYNTDLREDKRYLFDAADCLDALLPVVLGMLQELTFDETRMAAACDPFLAATDVADYLVEKGVPFREAHHLTGALVRRCLEGAGSRRRASTSSASCHRPSTRATTHSTSPPRSWRASARAAARRPRACASSSNGRTPCSLLAPAADRQVGSACRRPSLGAVRPLIRLGGLSCVACDATYDATHGAAHDATHGAAHTPPTVPLHRQSRRHP